MPTEATWGSLRQQEEQTSSAECCHTDDRLPTEFRVCGTAPQERESPTRAVASRYLFFGSSTKNNGQFSPDAGMNTVPARSLRGPEGATDKPTATSPRQNGAGELNYEPVFKCVHLARRASTSRCAHLSQNMLQDFEYPYELLLETAATHTRILRRRRHDDDDDGRTTHSAKATSAQCGPRTRPSPPASTPI